MNNDRMLYDRCTPIPHRQAHLPVPLQVREGVLRPTGDIQDDIRPHDIRSTGMAEDAIMDGEEAKRAEEA